MKYFFFFFEKKKNEFSDGSAKRRNDDCVGFSWVQALVTADSRRLTREFKGKLGEIFRTQLDLDGDGALNEAELDRVVLITEGTLSLSVQPTMTSQRHDFLCLCLCDCVVEQAST